MEDWQLDQMAEIYHWRTHKQCLSSDIVLRILNPKMIGTIQGLISTPVIASNTLNGIIGIIQLLNEAVLVASTFDARELLDCEQDRVIHTCQSLYENLAPLTGIRKADGHAEATVVNDHVRLTDEEFQRGYHNESS